MQSAKLEKINSVLLIDDDEITNILSRQIIRNLDFSNDIKLCYSGMEALDYLMEFSKQNNNTCPELILIDIDMPGINGFEFIEALNKTNFSNRDKVKTVILTVSTDLKNIRKAKKMGVNDYLIKPLTKGNLIQMLQNNKILV